MDGGNLDSSGAVDGVGVHEIFARVFLDTADQDCWYRHLDDRALILRRHVRFRDA